LGIGIDAQCCLEVVARLLGQLVGASFRISGLLLVVTELY
jgi:hypothetical protein